MNIGFASAAEVDALWPLVGERMERACRRYRSNHTAGDLWQMCRSGQAYLMVAHDTETVLMASVWRFETWPDATVFRCLCLVGQRARVWASMARDAASNAARSGGATVLTASGRRGWEAMFPDAREVSRTYEVSIDAR